MKRSYRCALALILFTAIAIRTLPLFRYELWGLDAGEYVYYTIQWTETGQWYRSIDGWASAYPFFPGLFIISSSASMLTGMDVLYSVNFFSPIIGAFGVLVIFLITHKITSEPKMSLFASGFFGVIIPLVYNHSQPKPETLAFFIMLLFLLLCLMVEKRKVFILLGIILLSITITHHLTTFYAFAFLLTGTFFSDLFRSERRPEDVRRWKIFTIGITIVLFYWLFAAPPFRETRIYQALGFPGYSIVLLPYIAVVFGLLITRFRRRYEFLFRPDFENEKLTTTLLLMIIPLIISLFFIIWSVFVNIPGTDTRLGVEILIIVPILLLGLLAVPSYRIIRIFRDSPHVIGWISLGLITLILGVVTGHSSLYPVRQIAFILVPISLCAGIGAVRFFDLTCHTKKRTTVYMILIIFMMAWNLPFAYPSQEAAGGYMEGIERPSFQASAWAAHSSEHNIATDQRLSASIFSYGKTEVTWTDGESIFFGPTKDDALSDIHEFNARYFMFDQVMLKGAAVIPERSPEPVDPELLLWYRSQQVIYRGDDVEIYLLPTSCTE